MVAAIRRYDYAPICTMDVQTRIFVLWIAPTSGVRLRRVQQQELAVALAWTVEAVANESVDRTFALTLSSVGKPLLWNGAWITPSSRSQMFE